MGDYDNDGFEDLYVTYYGKNVLYHNNGNGTFTDVSEKAGVAGNGKSWCTGCAFLDYDRDGKLDLMVANYVDYDSATALADVRVLRSTRGFHRISSVQLMAAIARGKPIVVMLSTIT